MRLCQLFLEYYVEHTKKWIVVLGPEEVKKVRTVNSAVSVTQCWKEFIVKADGTVLEKKRHDESSRPHFWQLAFKGHMNQTARGSVVEMLRVRTSPFPIETRYLTFQVVDLPNPRAKI